MLQLKLWLVLHIPVLHFPPSILHRLVVLHLPVINFTPIVLCWSSFFRSSIFSQPGEKNLMQQLSTNKSDSQKKLRGCIKWIKL